MKSNITTVCSTTSGNVQKIIKMFEQFVPAPTVMSIQKSMVSGIQVASVGGNRSIHRGDLFLKNLVNVTIINDRLSLPTVSFEERTTNTCKDSSGDIVKPDCCDEGSLNEIMRSLEFTGKVVFRTGP